MFDVASTIYLASYKGTLPGLHGLVNRVIRWITRSPYSHTEVCVGNPFDAAVPCLSSSGHDGGVRVKTMHLSADKWDVVPMPWICAQDVQDFWLREQGCKYDYAGVLRFAFPWLVGPSERRWFCTEAAAAVAGYPEPWRFSPADFHIVAAARA